MTDQPDSPQETESSEDVKRPDEAIESEVNIHNFEPETDSPFIDSAGSQSETATKDDTEDNPLDGRNEDKSDYHEGDTLEDDEHLTNAEEKRKRLDEDVVDQAGEQVDQQADEKKNERRKEFERRRISISRIEGSDQQRVRRLYVEPKTYAEFAEKVFTKAGKRLKSTDERIWLVAGMPRSGRMMTAIRLALDLMDLEVDRAESIWIYNDSEQSLQEVAAERNLPTNGVIIFENVFKRGRMNFDALFSRISGVNADLKRRKVWFIFTVPENSDEFPLDDLEGWYPIFRTAQPDLGEVFRLLVDEYFPEDVSPEENKRLKTLIQQSPEVFQSPRRAADLEYWFRLHGTNAGQLEKWIAEAKYQEIPAAREWFERLPNLNYKLYALLVVLFEGLDVTWLDQIYEASVTRMRELGMDGDEQFIDPRRIGFQAFDNHLRLRRRGNQIDFTDDGYRAEAKRQIENYQRLLWTLVDDFIGTVKVMNDNFVSTRKRQSKLNRRFRRDQENRLLRRRLNSAARDMDHMRHLRDVIASALANIGIYHLERMHIILDDLAHSDAAFVVLTASVMLAQIARQGDYYDLVIDVLGEWARSGDYDLMWASAVSISRVYESVARENPTKDVGNLDSQIPDVESERRRIAARALLKQLGDLLAELATNYDAYDDDYVQEERHRITELILTQLTEEFAQLIQEGVGNGDLPGELLTVYQSSKPEERALLALQVLPDASKRVEQVVDSVYKNRHESWCDQVRLSVVNAVAYIALTQPAQMSTLIEGWISRNNSQDPVRQVGHMALNRLFEQTDNLDAVLLEKGAFPLLHLFKTLLHFHRPPLMGLVEALKGFQHDETVTDEQQEKHRELVMLLTTEPLRTALKSTLNWYHTATLLLEQEKEENDEIDEEEDADSFVPDSAEMALAEKRAEFWEAQVYPELLKAINHATREQRSQFRQALVDIWLTQESENIGRVHRVAHALIARSHVMDGMVMDLPHAERIGVLITDGAADDVQVKKMFGLAHRLSALVPLYVMRLGDARQTFVDGIWKADITLNGSQHYFTVADLSQRGHRRPPLIMPLLQPRNNKKGTAFEADKTYFVVIYSTTPITDISDFIDTMTVATPAPVVTGNIFAQAKQAKAVQSIAPLWEWDGKLFIISSQPQAIPVSARNLIMTLNENATDYTYGLLQRQIAKMLHQITPDEMWRNLQVYVKSPPPRSAALLKTHIEHWLPLLNNIQHTHPRDDASLTIAWAVMALSRENCPDAVEIIESMLEGSEDDETTITRHQMGMACARMLFNFYDADPLRLLVATHSSLLRLLPAFNRAARDYSDLIPVWSVLLSWAQSSDWLTTFQTTTELDMDETNGSKLFESIDNLKERDARMAREWLERYDRLPEFWELFIDLGKSVDEFIDLLLMAHTYRAELNSRAENKVKRGRKLIPLHPPIPEPHLSTLLSFAPGNLNTGNPEIGVLAWRIEQVNAHYRELHLPDSKENLLQRARNMQTLAERLRDRLSRRLAGKLPEFKGIERYYGVIIVQGNYKKLAAKAAELAYTFAMMRKEGEFPNVVLTLHRQGSQDLVRYIRKRAKRNDKELFDSQKRLPLIGPALDRYPTAQVGFVIVLSDKPILDYDDWGEAEGWADRLWTMKPTTSKWQPSRGEHLEISEVSEIIMEQIAGRIIQRTNDR